ncbi:MAG: PAS domain S-box protein [Methanoregulaceae archaeon]|nr:PAS domain S-box protein [Methanoregulaceae archaeon]
MTRDISWWQVIALVVIIAGVLLTVWTAQQQDQQLRKDLLTKARIATVNIDPERIEALNGSVSDIGSTDYLYLKEQMVHIRAADPSIRFAYLMGQKPEGIFFYVDSEPVDSADYSPPGQTYDEATTPTLIAFSAEKEMSGGPDSDRWGTWVTAFIPVTDPGTGQLVAIFGMDVDARNWAYAVLKECAAIIAATLLILALVISFGLTQRRRERERRNLAASEDKFSRAFQTSPALMAISSIEEGRFIDVNSSFLRAFEFSREELLGKTPSELGLYSDPIQWNVIQDQLKGSGQVRDMDVKVITKNRETLVGLFSATTIDVAGIPCILMVILDISERKRVEDALRESEQRTRSLITSMDDLLFVLDKDLVFREYYEPHNGKLFVRPQYFIGRHFDEIGFPEPAYGIIRNALTQTLKTGTPSRAEYRLEIQNIPTWFDLHVTSFQGPDSLSAGLTCVVRDITERKLIEETLLKVNQKLNVLSQLTRRELTNEIFVLNSYLELALQEACGQDRIIENIQKCEQAARSITEITEFTKDYQDLGAKPPSWQNVKMTFLFGLSHVTMGDIPNNVEMENLEVFADSLLEKAFQGLVENSLAHGDHVTRIRVWHTETPGGVTIFYEDDGIGIPADKKEHIFLHREDTVTAGRSLFFTREILSITGLSIRETGEPGKGARFEITVPTGAFRYSGTDHQEET